MTYSDEFGNWKVLGEINVSFSEQEINFNPSSIKLLRFTATTDWEKWNRLWLQKSYALCAFSYGIEKKNKSKSFRYYPSAIPWVNEFTLIDKGNLRPLSLFIKAVQPYYYKGSYHYQPLPWKLKIEEYLND